MTRSYHIDPNIKKAETLPSSFYRDKNVFEEMKDNIFAKSWQWVGDANLVPSINSVYPFVLLDDFLAEPMFLSRNGNNQIQCFTNVCTHRGISSFIILIKPMSIYVVIMAGGFTMMENSNIAR